VRQSTIVIVLVLALGAASSAVADIRFTDVSLGNTGSLLFHAETESPGFGSYRTLFLTDIKTKQTTQFTYFPEEIAFVPGMGSLQIQNRFGVFRSDSGLKTFTALSIFPAFVNGYQIEEGKITPVKTSPDGRYLVYFKPTSGAFGALMLYNAGENKEIQVSAKVPLSLKSPPVTWSPNSRTFVYSKDFKLYYFSIDHLEKNRVISEAYRQVADGLLSSVQWDALGNLYYISKNLVFKIDSTELFTRGLYSGSVQIGSVVGKIAFTFEPNIDRFWLAPDGRKLILNKASQSVFFLYLTRNDEPADQSVQSLPHLSLPRSVALAKVIWSSADQITLLAEGMEKGARIRYIFRLAVPQAGAIAGFAQTTDQGVTDVVLSDDEKSVLLVKADRVEVLDYSGWRKTADIPFAAPLHALWKSTTEVVVAGERTVELYDLDKKTSSLIALSQAGASGFTADGQGLMTRSGDKAFVTAAAQAAWSPAPTFNVNEAATANADYRVFAQNVERSTYQNMLMVRDLKGLATAPLFEYKTFAYEQYPTAEDQTDPAYFNHGSRLRRREVALVLNGVYSAEGIAQVLTTLKDYGVKATFFLNGEFIRRFPDACCEIAASGHETGSLFYAFFNMTDARFTVDTEFIKKGLARNEDEYFKATGKELTLLWHAPYYFTSSSIIEASRQMNYAYVGSDVDSLDWVGKSDATVSAGSYFSAAELVEKILASKKPGSIIPIELGVDVNDRDDYLYQYLDILINALTRLGYDIVPVSQLIEHAR
jgi:peptidoglycan/xylan/chitin deacetylase (PgdA/CDA1 family)/WD40 repeat protein